MMSCNSSQVINAVDKWHYRGLVCNKNSASPISVYWSMRWYKQNIIWKFEQKMFNLPFRVFGSVYHAEIVIKRWTFAIFIAFKIDSIVWVNFTMISSTCFGKPRTEIITSFPLKIGAKDSGLKMSPLTTLSFSWVTVTRLGSLTMAVQV